MTLFQQLDTSLRQSVLVGRLSFGPTFQSLLEYHKGLVVPSGGGELRAQIGGKLMVLAAKNGPGMPTIL